MNGLRTELVMTIYHNSPTKGTMPCGAKNGQCPFEHFDSPEKAEQAYREQMQEEHPESQVMSKKFSRKNTSKTSPSSDSTSVTLSSLSPFGKSPTSKSLDPSTFILLKDR